MAKIKSTKGQTMIYPTLHRKLKIEQHKPHYKMGWIHAHDYCMFTVRIIVIYTFVVPWNYFVP